jgi:hypothetical protein
MSSGGWSAIAVLSAGLLVAGCDSFRSPVTPIVSQSALVEYGQYCGVNEGTRRSALSHARSGFAYIERECGVFFDKLAELSQAGRFSIKALNTTSLGTQTILQAAKVAAQNVTIVGAALTLTEAVFNAFVEQYAFAPYLYKVRELTWQSFDKHQRDNEPTLARLQGAFSADDYCDAFILVQQHADLCTLSRLQMVFDQQVAAATVVVNPKDDAKNLPAGAPKGNPLRLGQARSAPSSGYTPIRSPSFTVR